VALMMRVVLLVRLLLLMMMMLMLQLHLNTVAVVCDHLQRVVGTSTLGT
jgi:hypothetical protein